MSRDCWDGGWESEDIRERFDQNFHAYLALNGCFDCCNELVWRIVILIIVMLKE